MKILVVDDESSMPRLFEQRFRKEIREGLVEFSFAESAEQALQMLDTDVPGLVMILSDINMPGMSGFELLKKLRAHGIQIPIYMISAYETEAYQKNSKDLGADGFIPKPLDFESIRSIVLGVQPESK